MNDERTQASAICLQIRADIIDGSLAPAARLKTRTLAKRFDVGLSPIREALSRLSSEGWVKQSDRRGFSVISLNKDALNDLLLARRPIDEAALRDSINFGDDLWEEAVQISRFRLGRLELSPDTDGQIGSQQKNAGRRDFHLSLISACRSKRLIHFSEQLFDAIERYRLIVLAPVEGPQKMPGPYQKMADAAIARDADRAVELMNEHIDLTSSLVEQAMNDADWVSQ